jgi:hypothetical protein
MQQAQGSFRQKLLALLTQLCPTAAFRHNTRSKTEQLVP